MSKFPLWKYSIILIAIVFGIIYALPNLYGQVPAIQISATDSTVPLGTQQVAAIEQQLASHQLVAIGEIFDGKTLKVKFSDTDKQLQAKSLISSYLGTGYVVALNLVTASPEWLSKLHAYPMFLGLDLRGGVHFLLEVDMSAAVKKTLNKYLADVKRELKNDQIRYSNVQQDANSITLTFRDQELTTTARAQLKTAFPTMDVTRDGLNALRISIADAEAQKIKEAAIKQNILILHNRINELGVAEPIIQQEGTSRIAVELPGIQDTARAKDILGRTATLEVRLVNDSPDDVANAIAGRIPENFTLLDDRTVHGDNAKLLVSKTVELTGDNINDAQPSFNENGSPSVNLRLDSSGSAIFKQVTSDNVGKRMAMILVDNGRAQVITAPVIRSAIGGGRVEISGAMNVDEANNIALLLRSGSLAAPMTTIEEYTVGASLGRENIAIGFHSVLWGFMAIAIFMVIYYMIFGVISVISLAVNLLLLVAALSVLQATLTLPGLAAIALALGMAIDSNVLINERIREEIRKGKNYHSAIESGYEHAWATILDSNVTTLIAGLALLAFGTGPIKGFAVVHCLGIISSLFSAVLVSRGIVAFLYAKRRIKKLYI